MKRETESHGEGGRGKEREKRQRERQTDRQRNRERQTDREFVAIGMTVLKKLHGRGTCKHPHNTISTWSKYFTNHEQHKSSVYVD